MDIEGNHATKFRGPGLDGGTEAPLWVVTTISLNMGKTIDIPVTNASISLTGGPVARFRNANSFS
jgi:hypothetical protein